MKVQSHGDEKKIHIEITGSINQTGAEELKKYLNGLSLEQTQEVVMDFAKVSYIGSAGVGKILLLYKNLVLDDASIRLINVAPDIYSLLMDMKLDEIFFIEKGK
jgi:anti-anti-sigma factor